MTLVLDASMALAWLFERESAMEAAQADQSLSALADTEALVPPLWHAEVINALLVAERRKLVSPVQTADYLSRLSHLPIITDETPPGQYRESIFALGREYGLSAYDAAYLELALRTDSFLATFDRKLANATLGAQGRVYGD